MEHGSLSIIRQGLNGPYYNLNSWENANCAKSFVTREGVESVVKRYVVPKVGLPWPEWIKT
jgi:hypothetical protein